MNEVSVTDTGRALERLADMSYLLSSVRARKDSDSLRCLSDDIEYVRRRLLRLDAIEVSERATIRAQIATLRAELDGRIHSCHANCQRVECVQRRALEQARAARMCQPGSDGWEEAQQAIADALGMAWPPVTGRE